MALYELDCRGTHYDDLRAGTIASMLGNIYRDAKKHPRPFGPLDFMPWNKFHELDGASEPVLLESDDEQSELILRTMFPKIGNEDE